MHSFTSKILKLGVNPYVGVPDEILEKLFKKAGKTKGPLPIRGTLNGNNFTQTIVKYQGAWRLYLNTTMRRSAGIDVGDIARMRIEYDTRPRIVPMHPMLRRALAKNKEAHKTFKKLSRSRQKEILRYLGSLKNDETVNRILSKVLRQLAGKKTKGLNFLAQR